MSQKKHDSVKARHQAYNTRLRRLVELGRLVESGAYVPAGEAAGPPPELAPPDAATPEASKAPAGGRVKVRSTLPHLRREVIITAAGALSLDEEGCASVSPEVAALLLSVPGFVRADAAE